MHVHQCSACLHNHLRGATDRGDQRRLPSPRAIPSCQQANTAITACTAQASSHTKAIGMFFFSPSLSICTHPYIKLVLEPCAFWTFCSTVARAAAFSHVENQPRNQRFTGCVLNFETNKKQIRKGPRKCPQLALAERLDSESDRSVTTPSPLRAFVRS